MSVLMYCNNNNKNRETWPNIMLLTSSVMQLNLIEYSCLVKASFINI